MKEGNLFDFTKPPVLIKSWEDLVGLENDKYRLKIDLDGGNGWIVRKEQTEQDDVAYLSTHTFYGSNYKWSAEELRKRGFNVQLSNWDAE